MNRPGWAGMYRSPQWPVYHVVPSAICGLPRRIARGFHWRHRTLLTPAISLIVVRSLTWNVPAVPVRGISRCCLTIILCPAWRDVKSLTQGQPVRHGWLGNRNLGRPLSSGQRNGGLAPGASCQGLGNRPRWLCWRGVWERRLFNHLDILSGGSNCIGVTVAVPHRGAVGCQGLCLGPICGHDLSRLASGGLLDWAVVWRGKLSWGWAGSLR